MKMIPVTLISAKNGYTINVLQGGQSVPSEMIHKSHVVIDHIVSIDTLMSRIDIDPVVIVIIRTLDGRAFLVSESLAEIRGLITKAEQA